jgi:hypothetical protein
MEINYYLGIDPGQTGGIGIIDGIGRFVAAHRWNIRDPIYIYDNVLLMMQGLQVRVYIEDVNLPQTGTGIDNQYSRAGNLMVNYGIWQGWLMAAGLPYQLIAPATWQAAFGLSRWKKRLLEESQFGGAPVDSPLTLARKLWPTAPLEFKLDDGKAVGLLLSGLARQDHLQGIDRGELRARAHEKAKIRKKAKKSQGNIIAPR